MSNICKNGWTRTQSKVYRKGSYTIEYVDNARCWVIYDKDRKALFNSISLTTAIQWFDKLGPSVFPV